MKNEESAKLKEAGRDRMIWSDEMGSEQYIVVKEIEVEEKKRGNKTGFKRSQRSREEQGGKKDG